MHFELETATGVLLYVYKLDSQGSCGGFVFEESLCHVYDQCLRPKPQPVIVYIQFAISYFTLSLQAVRSKSMLQPLLARVPNGRPTSRRIL